MEPLRKEQHRRDVNVDKYLIQLTSRDKITLDGLGSRKNQRNVVVLSRLFLSVCFSFLCIGCNKTLFLKSATDNL